MRVVAAAFEDFVSLAFAAKAKRRAARQQENGEQDTDTAFHGELLASEIAARRVDVPARTLAADAVVWRPSTLCATGPRPAALIMYFLLLGGRVVAATGFIA